MTTPTATPMEMSPPSLEKATTPSVGTLVQSWTSERKVQPLYRTGNIWKMRPHPLDFRPIHPVSPLTKRTFDSTSPRSSSPIPKRPASTVTPSKENFETSDAQATSSALKSTVMEVSTSTSSQNDTLHSTPATADSSTLQCKGAIIHASGVSKPESPRSGTSARTDHSSALQGSASSALRAIFRETSRISTPGSTTAAVSDYQRRLGQFLYQEGFAWRALTPSTNAEMFASLGLLLAARLHLLRTSGSAERVSTHAHLLVIDMMRSIANLLSSSTT